MSRPGELPEEISHYRILDKVGSGGMGDVFLAEDLRLGRRVALKILPREPVAGSESLHRFHLEARTTSALNHPNIVTIHDIGQVGGYEFIAQEYVPGRTIRELLDQGPLTVPQAVDVAIGVTSALLSAHEADVVHRDIKPENIMVRDDGLVKVLDFGIAKLSNRRAGDSGADDTDRILTDPGSVIGTFNYMSPEQILTFEPDQRADIFSLGVVLFEMLTGAAPFRRETRGDTVKAILFDQPPEIDLPDVPDELRELVARMMKKERSDRIQSSAVVLDSLVSIREVLRRNGHSTFPSLAGLVDRGFKGDDQDQATQTIPRGWLWPALVMIALLIATLFYLGGVGGEGRPIESIAVVPFETAGTDPRVEFFATVITEETTQRLAQIGSLEVVAANTMKRYHRSSKSAVEIGRELDLDALVVGRVYSEGDDLRVSIDVVEVEDGTHLWGKTYTHRSSDLSYVQATISRDLSDELKIELSGGEQERVSLRPTDNPTAYDEYLRGRYVWREDQRRNCRDSINHFERAIELDPMFALAYSGLADCYNILGSYGEVRPDRAFPAAMEYAHKAVSLDDSLGPAHVALAYALQNYEWDFRRAEQEYELAFELEPSNATGRYWYGGFLALMGRFEEASEQRALAHSLDPLSMTLRTGQGTPYLLARDYERAISHYKRAIHVDPTFPQAHRSLGWAYLAIGNKEREAINEFLAAERLEGRDPERSPDLAYAYARAGDEQRARSILARLQSAENRFVPHYDFALIHVALGEFDEAFRRLDLAVLEKSNRVTALRVDPALDPIRDDPRFDSLLWRTGLHMATGPVRPSDGQ